MAQSAKQQAANQIRTLTSMRNQLLCMSASWDELDNFFVAELERLSDAVERVRCGMDNFRKEKQDGNQ